MKTLTLTGIGSEQNFVNGNTTSCFLVFNNGELRVPCSEESALIVIKAMYGDEQDPEEPKSNGTSIPIQADPFENDDDHSQDANGIDQI